MLQPIINTVTSDNRRRQVRRIKIAQLPCSRGPFSGDNLPQGTGEDQADCDGQHGQVGDGEGEDVERVVADFVEVRVREGHDDGEDGRRDVLEHGSPEEGDLPVLAAGDDGVEVEA